MQSNISNNEIKYGFKLNRADKIPITLNIKAKIHEII